jgi:hypothetical protein
MRQFDYQRTIIAYHGCDESVVNAVLLSGGKLRPSENEYDWLGRGIYFWEHGPQRALEWARQKRNIKKPAVLGAVIHLGNCFDLLDVRSTEWLAKLFPEFLRAYKMKSRTVPKNDLSKGRHYLDCAVINWAIASLEVESSQYFHSVRALFREGEAVFKGSAIMSKSHIQIAVRDPKVIMGFFKPEFDKSPN